LAPLQSRRLLPTTPHPPVTCSLAVSATTCGGTRLPSVLSFSFQNIFRVFVVEGLVFRRQVFLLLAIKRWDRWNIANQRHEKALFIPTRARRDWREENSCATASQKVSTRRAIRGPFRVWASLAHPTVKPDSRNWPLHVVCFPPSRGCAYKTNHHKKTDREGGFRQVVSKTRHKVRL
jgi:hypothetical protein